MSEEKEKMLYEMSMHLIPSLSPEDALAAYNKIVEQIEGEGGSVKANQMPQDKALAYEMVKETAGKKVRYQNAHFGWVVFEASRESAPELGKKLKADKNVLRHLLINLPKEALLPRERKIPTTHREEVRRPVEKTEGPIDEASIDKTIEELVIE